MPQTQRYSKPSVQRFGTFRDLTRQGFHGAADGAMFGSTTGNNCQDFDVGGGMTTLTCIIGTGSR